MFRTLTVVAASLALAACQGTSTRASAVPASAPVETRNVGILVFDGLFITEYTAPFDIYKHVGKEMNVFTVAPRKGAITTYEGVELKPDYAFGAEPRIDVLVVPSGIHSIDTDLENGALIAWIQDKARTAEYVTSHCWGAFLLAKAGLLDGGECTTFPSSIDDLQKKFPQLETRKDQRFVVSGRTVTSTGGLAAYEAATYVVERLYGKEKADAVATGLVFAPQNRTYASSPRIL
ncbi:MAG TPA: DJ-1/PfpI family protein [Planctomycetota bacterium]